MLICSSTANSPSFHGALEAEGGVGDDAEGVFDFVGDFGGEAAGGAEPFLADGEFGGFGLGALLFFKEDLDAVATGGPDDKDEDALVGVFRARIPTAGSPIASFRCRNPPTKSTALGDGLCVRELPEMSL